MKKVCLILSEKEDPHVNAVLQHKEFYGDVEICLLDTKSALANFKINLTLTDNWSGIFNEFQTDNLKSIWYRRPKKPKANKDLIHKHFLPLAEEEMHYFLENFYRISDCKILPHPSYNREADHKLVQLKIAKSIGFKTPFTAITNTIDWRNYVPDNIEYFCIKSIRAYHWLDEEGIEFSLNSSKVHRRDLVKYTKDFILCPTLLQEYVEKRYEWRITVIDGQIFPCRLNSQVVKGAEVDWRIVDVSKIPHEIVDIPVDLSSKIMEYLNCFNLKFGAFDFIENKKGEFIFLECNPNGQWLWIEHMTKAKISNAIADFLFT